MALASLGSNPSIESTVAAYQDVTSQVLDAAAGKDGRVSTTEALRIRERRDGGALWAEDALAIIDGAGQHTMSRAKLERLLVERFTAAATVAAGPDGHLSLANGAQLPKPLRESFLYLRGKRPDPPPIDPATYAQQVQAQAFAAIDAGTAVQLALPPRVVRGRKPLFDHLPHAASNTRLTGYVASGKVYVSRSASFPTPLVGWYLIGDAP
jgi:hypothetical protein